MPINRELVSSPWPEDIEPEEKRPTTPMDIVSEAMCGALSEEEVDRTLDELVLRCESQPSEKTDRSQAGD